MRGPADAPHGAGDGHDHPNVLVVPCYNEAIRLSSGSWLTFLDEEPSFRIVFVDDGSSDGTAGVLDGLLTQRPGAVRVLRLDRNRGKAEAVRQGVLSALDEGARTVGYWDADLSTPLDSAPRFLEVLDRLDHIDVVMGARVQLLGRRVDRSVLRHYVGRVFAALASMTLGLRVYDTQCGAKIFRVTAGTADLFGEPFLSRWAFDVEVLARLAAQGAGHAGEAVYELPLHTWIHAPGSKVRPWDFPRSVWELLRIRLRYPPP